MVHGRFFQELNFTSWTQQWRPKLTPYRSFVLLSTVGLGSGKAIATARGLSLVATNIEWVTGVLVFSLIYVLGLMEHNPPLNRFVSWFLTRDILQHSMDEIHREYQHEYTGNLSGPIITGYRLPMTFSVTLFGLAKAYLMYQSLSPAALNAVDWISAVMVTSCLYVLGLYEDNPTNLMPYLFYTDCSPLVYASPWVIIYLATISLSFLWVKTTFKIAFIPLLDLRTIYDQLHPSVDLYSGSMPLPDALGRGLSNLSVQFIATCFFFLCFIAGVFVSLLIFRDLFHFIHGFSFIRVSLRTSLALLTRYQFDTPLLRIKKFFHRKMSRFVFKITICLIILPICAILFSSLSFLVLNMFYGLLFVGPNWRMLLLNMAYFLVCFLVLTILAVVCVLSFLYFAVCLVVVPSCSLASRPIPKIFDLIHTPA